MSEHFHVFEIRARTCHGDISRDIIEGFDRARSLAEYDVTGNSAVGRSSGISGDGRNPRDVFASSS